MNPMGDVYTKTISNHKTTDFSKLERGLDDQGVLYINFIVLLGTILFISFVVFLSTSFGSPITSLLRNRQDWTLRIHANGPHDSPTTMIPNYDSQRSCMEKGVQLMSLQENSAKEALFTCGLNCKVDNIGAECETICYRDGTCRD